MIKENIHMNNINVQIIGIYSMLVKMWSINMQIKQQLMQATAQGDRIETDAACWAVYTHSLHICAQKNANTSHWYPAFNHKQICYTHHTQTYMHIGMPTISPPIRHQTAVWGFPARAFDLVKWVSFRYTFLQSPSISKQPFVPITDYPSYLEAISLAD